MNIEEVKQYICKKPVVSEFKKDENTIYYKVNGKIFAIISTDIYPHIFLKNKPFINKILRNKFNFILPSNMMNNIYWNVIVLKDELTFNAIKKMIDISYEISLDKMNKRQKEGYNYFLENV